MDQRTQDVVALFPEPHGDTPQVSQLSVDVLHRPVGRNGVEEGENISLPSQHPAQPS